MRGKDDFSEYENRDIRIHPDSYLGLSTTIGEGTSINGPAYIDSWEDAPIKIGKYCAIGHGLKARSKGHSMVYANLQFHFKFKYDLTTDLTSVKGPISIGNNVWIGDYVVILSGVTIGDGAVLGAGSIVTKDIPPYSVAVGSPARVIKKRFSDEIIAQLVTINWWDWSDEKIRRNRSFFELDLTQKMPKNIRDIIVD